jgi:hypothetical protein
MRIMFVIALVLPLCGCGAFSDAVQDSKISETKKFEIRDLDTFRITEYADGTRIAIAASPMRIVSAGMNDILTFGTSYYDMSETVMKSAALRYLQSAERQCSIEGGRELSRMQWEFQYKCRTK